jgi:hypothetical protein
LTAPVTVPGFLGTRSTTGNEFSHIDGNSTFSAISRVRENSCAATDQYDNVMYYTSGGATG